MSQGFSRIKVGAHREPDQVVHAGAAKEQPGTSPAESDQVPARASGPSGEGSAAEAGTTAASAARQAPPVRGGAGGDEPFHETTLEDIESSRMPSAQRFIIVLAGLAVVAFAAWQLVGSAS